VPLLQAKTTILLDMPVWVSNLLLLHGGKFVGFHMQCCNLDLSRLWGISVILMTLGRLLMGTQNRLHLFMHPSSFKRLMNIHHSFVSLTRGAEFAEKCIFFICRETAANENQ